MLGLFFFFFGNKKRCKLEVSLMCFKEGSFGSSFASSGEGGEINDLPGGK